MSVDLAGDARLSPSLILIRLLRVANYIPHGGSLLSILRKRGVQIKAVTRRTVVIFGFIVLLTNLLACTSFHLSATWRSGWITKDPAHVSLPAPETGYVRALHFIMQVRECRQAMSWTHRLLHEPAPLRLMKSDPLQQRDVRDAVRPLLLWRARMSSQTLFTTGYGDGPIPVTKVEPVFGACLIVAKCFLNALLIAAFTPISANQVGTALYTS